MRLGQVINHVKVRLSGDFTGLGLPNLETTSLSVLVSHLSGVEFCLGLPKKVHTTLSSL